MFESTKNYSTFLDDYRKDIFVMLLALGADRTEASDLLSDYDKDIVSWAGTRPSSGPIRTAAMAARSIMTLAHPDNYYGL